MAQVVLVRHGQTEWNRVERFRGRIDIPLNETGLWQAERAARAIAATYQVSALYSSPLSRALNTAEAIGRAVELPVQVLPGVNDFSYGQWEGKSPEEVEAEYPEQYRLWVTSPQKVTIPGGESLRKLRARAAEAVEGVAARHPTETVVLVSHRAVCKALVCYLLGLGNSQLGRIELDNASISRFQRTEIGWVTWLLNETCHLIE